MSLSEFLEREAGHTIVAFLLIVFGCVIYLLGMLQEGREMIVFALGLMARSMGVAIVKGGGSRNGAV